MLSDDALLVAKARSGDTRAFETLFERYQTPILNYLHRMVGDRALAEDLTQDTFVKAFNALPKTSEDLLFKPWLYRIATNTALSSHRRSKIVRFLPFLSDHPSNESIEATVGRKQDIERALSAIPPHYASVLLLRHYQGLSLAETATALDITEAAAKLRLFRARKAFAAVYQEPLPTEPPSERDNQP